MRHLSVFLLLTWLINLSSLSVHGQPSVAVAEALDAPDLVWSSGGSASWESVEDSTALAGSAAYAVVGSKQSCWLQTTAQGPCLVRFRSRPMQSTSFDGNVLFQSSLTGGDNQSEWQTINRVKKRSDSQYAIIAYYYAKNDRVHLRWSVTNSNSFGLADAYLDSVSIVPMSEQDLGDALDSDLSWTNDALYPWFVSSEITHDGVDALCNPSDIRSALTTRIDGPGYLGFYYQAMDAVDGVTDLWVNYRPANMPASSWTTLGRLGLLENWKPASLFVPEGSWEVQIRLYRTAPTANGEVIPLICLDEFQFSPSPSISLEEALDAEDLVWSTTSPGWFGAAVGSHDGVDCVSTGPVMDHTPLLRTTVTGPRYLHYYAKQDGLKVERIAVHAMSGATLGDQLDIVPPGDDWQRRSLFLPRGQHEIVWSCTGNVHSPTTAYLDEIVLDPILPASNLSETLDNPRLVFEERGTGLCVWSPVPVPTAVNGSAALALAVGEGSHVAELRTLVKGPVTLSYKVKHNSVSYSHPILRCQLKQADQDDSLFTSASFMIPSTDWREYTLPIPYENAVVRWLIDGSASAISVHVLLDDIQITPLSTLPLNQALDNEDLVFSTGSGAFRCMGQTSMSHDGEDAVAGPLLPGGQAAWIRTVLPGPGWLRFHLRPTAFWRATVTFPRQRHL